ncbi:sodium/glutamate symporter [Comamonas sp. Sa2CVA6]|jgi:ESS family glutamate:Na+ symporter|uniref:Sodium/glutamate symporter n=1 Tax=Comamonas avium TaxID=2762231 RepID=A0ABR8S8K8_9BURK|nr:sodium/glutamate symporter [Comamonas avium]
MACHAQSQALFCDLLCHAVTLPETLHIPAFQSFTLAILLFFAGQKIAEHWSVVRRYSIPEPVVGGFLCACVVGLMYLTLGTKVEFDLNVRDTLLLYFFAAIGLRSDLATLREGGKPLLILLVLATVFIALQNMLGMGVAQWFGLDARAGLMTGSISLTGGVGTTLAWGPVFVEKLGISNAVELGMASNMVGMIAACTIGGPIASYLLRRHGIAGSNSRALDVGVAVQRTAVTLDYYGVLRAWLWLNMALMIGGVITPLFHEAGLQLPMFVGCLLGGIILRNTLGQWMLSRKRRKLGQFHWNSMRQGLLMISDICLGMFLTMALMGLQLWALQGVMGFVMTVLVLQILMTIGFALFVVFRCMGKDYEAAVITAGFGGIALGSTATAVANMTAVARSHGAAHRAFIVVPLVCGFFVDIVNAVIIQALI